MQIIKITGVEETLKKISHIPRVLQKAEVSALNKIAAQGRTQASRSIREEYNVKAKDIKPALKLTKAQPRRKKTDGRLFAVLSASGRPIPLMKFAGRPAAPAPQKGVPVQRRKPATVKVLKKGPRKVVKHAFVARMDSGHVGIFKRQGKETNPIKERYSVGIPAMFRRARKATIRLIQEKASSIMKREVNYFLDREINRKKG